MNNAGLPGTGIGGLFYLLLALWMPVAELHATLRGRSSRDRWRQVGTQFALACGIIAAVAGTAVIYLRLAGSPHVFGLGGRSLVLAPVLLAALLLGSLVVVLRVWARWQRPLDSSRLARSQHLAAHPLVEEDLDSTGWSMMSSRWPRGQPVRRGTGSGTADRLAPSPTAQVTPSCPSDLERTQQNRAGIKAAPDLHLDPRGC